MPQIIREEFLSYRNSFRNSDKLFNLFIIRADDGTFECLTEYGRRGQNLVRSIICSTKIREVAEDAFRGKLHSKQFHRSTPYVQEPRGREYSEIVAEYSITDAVKTKEVKRKETSVKRSPAKGILNPDQLGALEI